MAAAEPEVLISQLVDVIATNFRRLDLCFCSPCNIGFSTFSLVVQYYKCFHSMLDQENVDVAVEIKLLSGLQAEI